MCGIIGFIGSIPNGFQVAYDGIKILQNRGYDSCGICSLKVNGEGKNKKAEIISHKYASRKDISAVNLIGKHEQEHKNNQIITIHCRWCTHGAINDTNAHPHMDNEGRVSVVHNGIIENFQELKDFLEDKGYVFKSETDTEVIAILIGFYLNSGYNMERALNSTVSKLEGTWGLAVVSTLTPDQLYLCKKGSPLLLGYEKNFAIAASESSAILNYVKSYFTIEDNEIITVGLKKDGDIYISHKSKIINDLSKYFDIKMTKDEIWEHRLNNGLVESACSGKCNSVCRGKCNSVCRGEIADDTVSVGPQLFATTPDPYEHWMLKEIMEQPKSLHRTLNMGGRLLDDYHVHLGGLRNHREDLLKIKNLLILACGTSYHAALLGAKYFKMLGCIPCVQVLDASEFSHKDIPHPYSDVGILVLSQSGETKDVHKAMQIAEEAGIFIFSIVNVVGSLIAREASCGIYLNAGREVAVASTKSFTSQVLALALIAVWYAERDESSKQKRKLFIKSIRNLCTDTQEVLKRVVNDVQKVVDILKEQWQAEKKSLFILGRDLAEPIAYEGSLKLKEISYLHAEGYPGGSLKHGPFALIEEGTPIILIMLDDEYASKIESAGMEVKARGAQTILLTNRSLEKINTKIFDHIIQVPENKIFGSLLTILPLQYLSYKLALEFGYNPDFPRNLAKVCTTF